MTFAVLTHNAVHSSSWYVNYVYLQDKLTPLMCAAVGGPADVVQVLLSRQDVDINMRDKVCRSQWEWTLTTGPPEPGGAKPAQPFVSHAST